MHIPLQVILEDPLFVAEPDGGDVFSYVAKKIHNKTSITPKFHVNDTHATKFLASQISQFMRCTLRNLVIVADVHTWQNLTFENCYQIQIFLAEKAKRGSSTSISCLCCSSLKDGAVGVYDSCVDITAA